VIELRRYITPEGKDVFGEWLTKLQDARAQAKIVVRLDQLLSLKDYKERTRKL
jgi:putative component of toxin-antitoxin plasmid stabilization module